MYRLFLILFFTVIFFNSCEETHYIEGCMDPMADNYNAYATDPFSCPEYGFCEYYGCTDPDADFFIFDERANIDDSSCTYTLHIVTVIGSPWENQVVELLNNSGLTVDISNYKICDLKNSVEYIIPATTTLNQGQLKTYQLSVMGFEIDHFDLMICLKDTQDMIISTYSRP